MPDQHREVIDRFTGPYAFLSNFHPCRVTFYGMTFPSVEAAFQAAKCADHRDRAQFLAMTPEQAKRRGRQIRMRDDWGCAETDHHAQPARPQIQRKP